MSFHVVRHEHANIFVVNTQTYETYRFRVGHDVAVAHVGPPSDLTEARRTAIAFFWQSIDATTAFLKSDWITPGEARRTFGDTLPGLPPEAFRGRDLRVASKRGPRIARAQFNFSG